MSLERRRKTAKEDSMRRFRRYLLPVLGMIAAFAVTGGPAFAQTTGAIVGTVSDADGRPLPGVSVEVTSPNLQGTRTAVTSGDGRYRFSSLPPGVYKITATLTGMGTVEKNTPVA